MKISRTNRFNKKNSIVKSEKSLLERNLGGTSKSNTTSTSAPSVSLSAKGSFISSLQQELSSTPHVRTEVVEAAKRDINTGNLGSDNDVQQAVTAIILEL